MQTWLQSNGTSAGLKKVLIFLLKGSVTLITFWILSQLIDEKWNVIQNQIRTLNPSFYLNFIFVVLLMPVNWALEIFKWKYLISDKRSVKFKQAMQEVLAGLSLNFIIPFTLGDLMARTMQHNHKKSAGKSVIVARVSSIGVTFYFGFVAVFGWVYLRQIGASLSGNLILGVYLFLTILIILISIYQKRNTQRIILLSFTRYLIFTFQFLLLLTYFIPDLAFYIYLMSCGWVFLARSVVPSFFGALGIRELSAVAFFSIFIENPEIAIVPGLILWLINVVVPSVFGFWAIFKLKLNLNSTG